MDGMWLEVSLSLRAETFGERELFGLVNPMGFHLLGPDRHLDFDLPLLTPDAFWGYNAPPLG